MHGPPFAGRASNWQSNISECYITMYSPTTRSLVLKRTNRTIVELLGNIFIHIAARSRLSLQMAESCKERIAIPWSVSNRTVQSFVNTPILKWHYLRFTIHLFRPQLGTFRKCKCMPFFQRASGCSLYTHMWIVKTLQDTRKC